MSREDGEVASEAEGESNRLAEAPHSIKEADPAIEEKEREGGEGIELDLERLAPASNIAAKVILVDGGLDEGVIDCSEVGVRLEEAPFLHVHKAFGKGEERDLK